MNTNRISAWLHRPVDLVDISRLWSLKRPRVYWQDYLFALFLAFLLPVLCLGIEWILTWPHQLFVARHLAMQSGPADSGEAIGWLWMALPPVITFLVFIPLLRYPVRCRFAAMVVCLIWIVFWLSGEAGVK
jgi:hypothetical protein